MTDGSEGDDAGARGRGGADRRRSRRPRFPPPDRRRRGPALGGPRRRGPRVRRAAARAGRHRHLARGGADDRARDRGVPWPGGRRVRGRHVRPAPRGPARSRRARSTRTRGSRPRSATFLDGARAPRSSLLPGIRDAALAYDARAADDAAGRTVGRSRSRACWRSTPAPGVRVVRVEPGHQLDPAAAFADPRDPNDHPLVVHLEREVLPGFANVGDGSHKWLEGIEDADPGRHGRARRVAVHVPPAVPPRGLAHAAGARAARGVLPDRRVLGAARPTRSTHLFRLLAAGFAIELVLVVVGARVRRRAAPRLARFDLVVVAGAARQRRAARGRGRARGRRRCGAHHRPLGPGRAHRSRRRRVLRELRDRGPQSSTGSRRAAGCPAVYAARLRCSWVELEAGSELRARLWHGARDLPGAHVPRAASRRASACDRAGRRPRSPSIRARSPGRRPATRPRVRRRTRRIGAAAIAFAGVLEPGVGGHAAASRRA